MPHTRTPLMDIRVFDARGEVLSALRLVIVSTNLIAAKFGGGLVSPR